ncbi:hypothetical protein NST02_23300 [Robertmurraya sp. FSL W8-0741]|uniref:hypothetical protein n=1 Tax=Robertmurraya sp. FSL W8-0741 TaxID=2954629 RepID=UPI0030F754E5
MNTLIIYDETGYVLSIRHGKPAPREPIGVPFLWVDIPDGKRILSVDTTTTPHQTILEDIPPSETDLLKEENLTLKLAIAELAETQEQAKLETQLALAELAESLHGGDE